MEITINDPRKSMTTWGVPLHVVRNLITSAPRPFNNGAHGRRDSCNLRELHDRYN